jgi:DNA-binding transcriptional ArsR family regulator
VFAALADPTRRRVLALIGDEGPLSATEVAARLPVTRQAVAKHLAALTGAGLVAGVRQGRSTRYRVTPDRLVEAQRWLAAAGDRWDRRLARLEQRVASSSPTRDSRK